MQIDISFPLSVFVVIQPGCHIPLSTPKPNKIQQLTNGTQIATDKKRHENFAQETIFVSTTARPGTSALEKQNWEGNGSKHNHGVEPACHQDSHQHYRDRVAFNSRDLLCFEYTTYISQNQSFSGLPFYPTYFVLSTPLTFLRINTLPFRNDPLSGAIPIS
jgi:hypothetical protein